MTAKLKLASQEKYYALTTDTVLDYLASDKKIAERLGGELSQWKAREVGDGNLNLVFIVEGAKNTVVVKQALPYVRLIGESWPLPLTRAHFEHLALIEEARWAPEYVPEVYSHDPDMALTVMEYLSPHIILRKGLIRGIVYPEMAQDLGKFLAQTLFHTSDLYLKAPEKKQKIAAFLTNTAMCQISEDLIFDEPYFDAPMNRHTPQLDEISKQFKEDKTLKMAVQEMKWRFQNAPEALIHGDLHTGSVMVTENDTRAIDPEFAFYGPIGFDVGAIIGNLFMAYFSQTGHEQNAGDRKQYAEWILKRVEILWSTFDSSFSELWCNNQEGDVYQARVCENSPKMIESRMQNIWNDTVGFSACKIIRRILGLAHVEDFEAIENTEKRAACEKQALIFARDLLLKRGSFKNIGDVVSFAKSIK